MTTARDTEDEEAPGQRRVTPPERRKRSRPVPPGEVLPDAAEAASPARKRRNKPLSTRWDDGARLQLGMLGISFPSETRETGEGR